MSYKDQRELAQLPDRIEKLEKEIASLHEAMGDPAYYQQAGDKIAEDAITLKELQENLASAYARWEVLESWTT